MVMTLAQLGMGQGAALPGFGTGARRPAGFNQLSGADQSDVFKRRQQQALAGMPTGLDPMRQQAWNAANHLPGNTGGLTNQQINYGEQGNMGARWDNKTGGMVSTTGQPYMANAGNGGGPINTGAAGGPMTGLGSMGGAPGNPALGGGVGGNAGPLGGAGSPGMGLGNPISDPVGGNTTLGGIGSGNGGASAGGLINSQIVPSLTEAPGNYTGGMDMSKYLNPEADFARQEGLKGIQSTYAGAGNLLSGPAMKGISDYASKSAINQSYQPAFQNYMADKGFNYGVDSGDRAFGYQAKLNDQTIPFNQQMQLGQLGLQGAQGQQSVQNLLATLLSQNSIAAGQAQGTGTMGQGNALSSALSSMLSNYLNQNMLNRIPGLTPTGGP